MLEFLPELVGVTKIKAVKKKAERERESERKNERNISTFIFRGSFNANVALGVNFLVARNFHGLL